MKRVLVFFVIVASVNAAESSIGLGQQQSLSRQGILPNLSIRLDQKHSLRVVEAVRRKEYEVVGCILRDLVKSFDARDLVKSFDASVTFLVDQSNISIRCVKSRGFLELCIQDVVSAPEDAKIKTSQILFLKNYY